MYILTNKLIAQSQTTYKTLKSIKCPTLGVNIAFNRHGWNHVLYDSSDRRRSEVEVRLRLFLLAHVREVISNFRGTPVQETRIIQISKKTIKVEYYELNHRISSSGKYIKVIIRKFPEGDYHYYSIRRGKKIKNPL